MCSQKRQTQCGELFSCIRKKRQTQRGGPFSCVRRERQTQIAQNTKAAAGHIPVSRRRVIFSVCQFKAHLRHPSDFFLRDAPVEDDRAPMLLIHMISGQDGRIDVAEKIAPVRGEFEIHPNMSLSLKRKGVCLPIMTMTHEHPIVIVKRHIRIGVAQCERHGKKLFARFHSSFSGECAAVANIFKCFFLKRTKQILLLLRSDSCTKEDYAI